MPNRIVVTKLGGPEVLKYEKYDLPKQLNSDLVRIKQTSIGLNYIDTYHRSGLYPLPIEFPFCLHREGHPGISVLLEQANSFGNTHQQGCRHVCLQHPLGANRASCSDPCWPSWI